MSDAPKEPDIPAIFKVIADAAQVMGIDPWYMTEMVNRAQGIHGTAVGIKMHLDLMRYWIDHAGQYPWAPPNASVMEELFLELRAAQRLEELAAAVAIFLEP